MDDTMLVGKIQREQQLDRESPHDHTWDHALREPSPKSSQGLAHELKDKTYVVAVGPLVLKVVDKMADISVAKLFLVPVSEMGQNLSLPDGLLLGVALSAEDLERHKFIPITCPLKGQYICQSMGSGTLTAAADL
jgi:hypothetical protein